jgi:uncharacterized membrane protein YkgB
VSLSTWAATLNRFCVNANPFLSRPYSNPSLSLGSYFVCHRTDKTRQKSIIKTQIKTRRIKMTLGTILMIVLILALVGAIPTWGYSSGWGYGPSGGIGFVLLIVLILVLLGHI